MSADELRRALAALSPRERSALRHHADEAAGKWADLLPRVSAVWAALADLVAEVAANEQARAAADAPEHHMRRARRPRA